MILHQFQQILLGNFQQTLGPLLDVREALLPVETSCQSPTHPSTLAAEQLRRSLRLRSDLVLGHILFPPQCYSPRFVALQPFGSTRCD